MMKRIVFSTLYLLISSACTPMTPTPSPPVGNMPELNKETLSGAVEFIVSSLIFIKKTSGDCSAILGKDDYYAQKMVDNWLSRNGREARLSQKFLDDKMATMLSAEKKDDVDYARAQIQKKLETNAISMQAAVFALGKNKNYTNQTTCYDFTKGLRLGRYDLKTLLKNYEEVVKLL